MNNKFIYKCFLLLIVFSAMSYFIQAVDAVVNHTYILWTVSRLQRDFGSLATVFKYAKEFFIILIFIYSFFKNYKARQISIIFIGIIVYGIVTSFINGNLNLLYIISGIRMLVYLTTVCMFSNTGDYYSSDSNKLLVIIKLLIITEALIVFSQVIFFGNIKQVGTGAFRFCGTFGNAAGLGYFTMASALCLMYISLFNREKLKFSSYIYFVIIFLLSISTGSRTAMLSNIVTIFIYTLYYLQSKRILPKKLIVVVTCLAILAIFPFIYNSLIYKVGRGNIMASGSMRIDILKNFFYTQRILDYFTIFSGYGIGYGTNISYSLGIESSFFTDSTIGSILYQYGVIGLVILTVFTYKILRNITIWCKKESGVGLAIPYVFSILIVSIAGNIFEQIFLIIILVYLYYFIRYKNNKKIGLENENGVVVDERC